MSTFGGTVTGVPPGAGEGAGERMSADAAFDGPTTFEDLFRRRYEAMVRVAFLLVGTRAEAEEVVQDAFARMELRWTRLDNPEGYLHRCVVNRCHDQLRRRRLEQRFLRLRRDELSELQADRSGHVVGYADPAEGS
jgi:DNA-directed RNA polymerase specialized sigma24 family protein